MSVGGDKDRHPQITPQHTQTQWENHPPANIGYQWTCHLCQSTFGTIEQREKHQHECPGRIPHVQALQLGRTYPPMHVTGETFRPDRYQQTSQIPDFSQVVRARPPNPGYQHTPVPATYQHISGRRTQLLWLKETPTMDLQVTYIDEAEGGVVLKWDPISQLFEGGADLSIGQHSGCLTLNTSDVVLPITPFLVEHGGPSVQKIIISSGRKRMSNPHMGQPAEMERERTNRGSIRTLEETVNRLTTDLDNRNNELVQQRQVNDRYKQQNINLSQQMEVLSVEIQQLKASDNPVTVVPLEIEKLTRQIQESEKKNEMLEREAHKLKEEKISANDYSDYLYQQKQFFESQLQKAEERFKESQSQIDELTRKLDILTEKESAPPPLPTRSKPVSKEKDTKPANEELANLQ